MSLREKLLDALIDGHLGKGIVVTRQELIVHFPEEPVTYTGVFLSNSEIKTGTHSPTYEHFTVRAGRGRYRIHPQVLLERMRERHLLTNEGSPSEGFVTYSNTHNRHATVHRDGCRQIKKRGGIQRYNQGQYHGHATFEDARTFANSTGLPLVLCSYCKPGTE